MVSVNIFKETARSLLGGIKGRTKVTYMNANGFQTITPMSALTFITPDLHA